MNRPLQSFVDEVLDGFEYYKFGAFKTILDEDENLTRIDMKETEQIIHFLFEECIITLKDVKI